MVRRDISTEDTDPTLSVSEDSGSCDLDQLDSLVTDKGRPGRHSGLFAACVWRNWFHLNRLSDFDQMWLIWPFFFWNFIFNKAGRRMFVLKNLMCGFNVRERWINGAFMDHSKCFTAQDTIPIINECVNGCWKHFDLVKIRQMIIVN